MEVKEKRCKSIGKSRGHIEGCGKMSKNRRYGLCPSCYARFILDTEPGRILLEKATLKATKPRRELEKAFEEKKNREGLTTLLKSVRTVCHEYIRLRDKGKPCVSCNTQWKNDFHACHYYKAELYSTLKFNEFNINGGCIQCNTRKEGNLSEYTERLPSRIGKESFDELNRLAGLDKKIDHKWDREELISLRKYYRDKIKSLCL